jgi:ubiquinone/menaquinone biosynthesis C-methylase UbiE
MPLNFLRRRGDRYTLVVGMTGVKMGDRVLQLGCAHGARLGAIAKQVGLSGRAVAVVPDQDSGARAEKGAAQAGALVEVQTAPPTQIPSEDAAFDLVVIDDTGGLLGTMSTADRGSTVREALRILRPGGRVMVIGTSPAGAVGRFLSRRTGPAFDPEPSLQADGFKSVRRLAEREGLLFVEGLKPRTAAEQER